MKTPRIARTLLLLVTGVLTGCGSGSPELSVRDAWSRPTARREDPTPGEGASAPGVVYLTIVNTGQAADRLLSVSTSVCESPELHRTLLVDDRMQMELAEDGIEIPLDATVNLEPGGAHIMLLDLYADLFVGEHFELELEFEVSGTVRVQSEVRAP
jgi:copper(I)-binding protein